ncbi:MAG: hypothetical protein ACAI25_16860, partial [Planctomycetota bacterium]
MCGLIGIVQGYDPKASSDLSPLVRGLEALAGFDAASDDASARLDGACGLVESLAAELLVWAGFRSFSSAPDPRARAADLARKLVDCAEGIDKRLAEGRDVTLVAEKLAAAAVRARDLAWKLERDALENVKKVGDLLDAGQDGPQGGSIDKLRFELWRLNLIFNQLERLEVRGRDSGGLGTIVHLSVQAWKAFAASVEQDGLAGELERRRSYNDFRDGSIVIAEGVTGMTIAFAHKIAREVGELGANVRELRARAKRDRIFRLALGREDGLVQTFAHTRWASNGIINEANCHPLSNEVEGGIASRALAAT